MRCKSLLLYINHFVRNLPEKETSYVLLTVYIYSRRLSLWLETASCKRRHTHSGYSAILINCRWWQAPSHSDEMRTRRQLLSINYHTIYLVTSNSYKCTCTYTCTCIYTVYGIPGRCLIKLLTLDSCILYVLVWSFPAFFCNCVFCCVLLTLVFIVLTPYLVYLLHTSVWHMLINLYWLRWTFHLWTRLSYLVTMQRSACYAQIIPSKSIVF